jgi:hypothetical protein
MDNFCAQNRNYLQTSGAFLIRLMEDEGARGSFKFDKLISGG